MAVSPLLFLLFYPLDAITQVLDNTMSLNTR